MHFSTDVVAAIGMSRFDKQTGNVVQISGGLPNDVGTKWRPYQPHIPRYRGLRWKSQGIVKI